MLNIASFFLHYLLTFSDISLVVHKAFCEVRGENWNKTKVCQLCRHLPSGTHAGTGNLPSHRNYLFFSFMYIQPCCQLFFLVFQKYHRCNLHLLWCTIWEPHFNLLTPKLYHWFYLTYYNSSISSRYSIKPLQSKTKIYTYIVESKV